MPECEEPSRLHLAVGVAGLVVAGVIFDSGNGAIYRPAGAGGTSTARFQGINRRFDYDGPLVQNPPIVTGDEAQIDASAEVIGVTIGGHHRAYRLAGMCLVETHVVNDVVNRVPVTVTYCDLRRSVRALTRAGEFDKPLDVRVRGFVDRQGMLLEINGQVVPQESESLSAEHLDFELTTWSQWKAAHPDSDVYLGRELDPHAESNSLRNLSLVSPGIVRPSVERALRANIADSSRVIGVAVQGRHRAYRVLALSDPRATVVNDVIGKTAVTVTYNHWSDLARAFTKVGAEGAPLAIGLRGWNEGKMLLEIDGRTVPQDSDQTKLGTLRVEMTTWKQWKSAHPDTDIYTGLQTKS